MSYKEHPKESSYWTLRRKLKSRVDEHIAEIQNYGNCSHSAIDPFNLTSNMCSSNADVVETESLESVFSNSNEANCENQLKKLSFSI